MKLNEKILHCRKAAGLSQEALAAKLGVSRQALSKWELGDTVPELDNLVALAKTFGVTTDELLGLEEPARETEQSKTQEQSQPQPLIPEDQNWVFRHLRGRFQFRQLYTPVWMGLLLLISGVYECITLQHYPEIPFVQKTILPMRVLSIVQLILGGGILVWGIARLITHDRKGKK